MQSRRAAGRSEGVYPRNGLAAPACGTWGRPGLNCCRRDVVVLVVVRGWVAGGPRVGRGRRALHFVIIKYTLAIEGWILGVMYYT